MELVFLIDTVVDTMVDSWVSTYWDTVVDMMVLMELVLIVDTMEDWGHSYTLVVVVVSSLWFQLCASDGTSL